MENIGPTDIGAIDLLEADSKAITSWTVVRDQLAVFAVQSVGDHKRVITIAKQLHVYAASLFIAKFIDVIDTPTSINEQPAVSPIDAQPGFITLQRRYQNDLLSLSEKHDLDIPGISDGEMQSDEDRNFLHTPLPKVMITQALLDMYENHITHDVANFIRAVESR